MGAFIDPADLTPFAAIDSAKAAAMVEDAEAMAVLTAPCLADLAVDDPKRGAVKAILRGAILRWNDAGSGAVQSRQVGPFGQSIDTRQSRRAMFWPTEIEQLQGLCASGSTGKAFAVDVVSTSGLAGHAPWCDLMFLGADCSCGYSLAGYPIYEGGLL